MWKPEKRKTVRKNLPSSRWYSGKNFKDWKQLPAQPYRCITGLVQTRFSMMVSFSKSIGMMIACSAKEVRRIRSDTLQVMTWSFWGGWSCNRPRRAVRSPVFRSGGWWRWGILQRYGLPAEIPYIPRCVSCRSHRRVLDRHRRSAHPVLDKHVFYVYHEKNGIYQNLEK